MRAWLAALVFVTDAGGATSAFAQLLPLDQSSGMPSTKSALALYDKRDIAITIYMKGLADGIIAARAAGSEEAFCLPDKKPGPSTDAMIAKVKVLIAKTPVLEVLPIPVTVVAALHAEFPCQK